MNNSQETEGVNLLKGDPKVAILKLSIPMIIAMLLMSTYNLVNAVWVAGLGSDALAAVGFITPLFMVLIGLGNGLGAGATSVIARRIGAGDRNGANGAAMQAILLVLGISVVITVLLIALARPLMILFGAGKTVDLAVEYGNIVFAGTVLILFTNVVYAILRAEGDTKRTMYVMGASSILNIILDPILIYYFKMGIAGAAWGMIVSLLLVTVVLLYWFLIKKDTYVNLSWKVNLKEPRNIRDILGVGLPASCEFFLMSFLAIFINAMLVMVSGTDAVAVYTAGWRVVFFAIIPLVAISTSVVSVTGAAYGGRHFEKFPVIHSFSIILGIGIAIAISILTWLFASQISFIFTYSAEGAHLAPAIASFLATMCIFYPFVPPGIMSSSIFQGTGRGISSLILNVLRNMVFMATSAYLLGVVFGLGEHGVWYGIVIGDILGGIVGFIWVRIYISRLMRYA
ncbi:MATE family efflux transporter [Methanospirillum lacunae]|uniref:MATE family efflux transporter n=1 Tax=Methanospirillum lacunae TaxID=668570 RepID=A0A2V2NBV6_9EURY|nr:MATE family efflux transporter [Methanospirillum lacunae]PWR73948.1 MATE family efflux transporter [Methanospirillum lacunae]